MSLDFSISASAHRALSSLYQISLIVPQTDTQEYFKGVMITLTEFFPVRYAALLLSESEKGILRTEGIFGTQKENHPRQGTIGQGIIHEVLQTRKPAVIYDTSREPFYEKVVNRSGEGDPLLSSLLCVPLMDCGSPMGVMTITPFDGSQTDPMENFRFFSVLSAIISPGIKACQWKKMEAQERWQKAKWKTALLEEILEERFTEALSKIDPYVEKKSQTGLLADIVSLVEKILIKSAMEKVGYVQTSAAQLLGINRNTLRTKLKDLKIKFR